jgi:hypothetical protein
LLEMARALDLDLVVVPRRLRATLEQLIDGVGRQHSAVYTGLGFEPYDEGDSDDASGARLRP